MGQRCPSLSTLFISLGLFQQIPLATRSSCPCLNQDLFCHTIVLVMAWVLFDAKPISGPMLSEIITIHYGDYISVKSSHFNGPWAVCSTACSGFNKPNCNDEFVQFITWVWPQNPIVSAWPVPNIGILQTGFRIEISTKKSETWAPDRKRM